MASPSSIQPAPTTSVRRFSAITTIQAENVPRPPRTAVSGSSTPRKRKLKGGFQPRLTSGKRWRNRSTEMCATVNESMAPNEYRVARKSVLPGTIVSAATPENTRIAMYGVLKRG